MFHYETNGWVILFHAASGPGKYHWFIDQPANLFRVATTKGGGTVIMCFLQIIHTVLNQVIDIRCRKLSVLAEVVKVMEYSWCHPVDN